jgi:glycosyltransferase involved in cell wall biosynthesis
MPALNSPMNVVLVCPVPNGGHALYISELAAALARLPEDVCPEVVAPADLEDRFRSTLYPLHTVLPAWFEPKIKTSFARQLKLAAHILRVEHTCIQWLRQRPKTDIVHFQELFWLSAPQMRAFRRLDASLVDTVHNLKPHRYSGVMPRKLEDAISLWMMRQCDGLLVHTEALHREACELLGGRHPPIFVAPHGLSQPVSAKNIAALRERLSWRRMLLFGTIRRNKGPHVALQALKTLDGFHLTIAGRIDEPAYWQDRILPMVAELRRMGRSVEIIDRFVSDDETADLFAAHSFALLPYTRDFHAQSGVLHLAIGLQTPVVSTSVGGLPETISRWDIGEIAPPEAPDALAAAIRRLCDRNPDTLDKNLHEAREGLSWNHAARITVEAYRKVRSGLTDSNANAAPAPERNLTH